MTSGRLFDGLTSVVFTSFPVKPFDVNVVDRSQAKHFLAANVDILVFN